MMTRVGTLIALVLAGLTAWIVLGLVGLGYSIATADSNLVSAMVMVIVLAAGLAGGFVWRKRPDTVYW